MLHHLKLKNFKSFEHAEIPLKPLTLLAGINGMGKSTLIQSLLALAQSETAGLLEQGILDLAGDLVELGRGKDVLHEYAKDDVIEIALSDAQGTRAFAFDYSEKLDQLRCAEGFVLDASASVLGGDLRYLCAERLGPRKSLPLSESKAKQRQLGVQGEYVFHLLMMYGRERLAADDRRIIDADMHSLQAMTSAWMQAISPGVQINIEEIPALDAIKGSYAFAQQGDVASAEYRPTNVGFGISYSLPIIVACLISKPGDLLIIENPEAHIHPKGQTELSQLLARTASMGVQVMIETHSDHIMNGIRLAVKDRVIGHDAVAFHYIEKSGRAASVSSPVIAEDGRLNQWPAGFFDEYEDVFARLIS